MKNKTMRFFAAFFTGAVLLGLSTCETLPDIISDPAVSFSGVTLRGVSFSGVDLLAKIDVENNNPFSIPFPETDWEFFVSGSSFLKGTLPGGSRLGARSVSAVEIPFTVPYEGLYAAVSTLLNSDEVPYTVKAGLRFPIPVIREKTFNAEFSGKLPLLKVPKLSFGGVQFNSRNPQELVLSWSVENRNAFDINLDKLEYDLKVNDTEWARGFVGDASGAGRVLPARKTTAIPITVRINAPAAAAELAAIILGGKEVRYTCGGEAVLRPDFPGTAPLTLPFVFGGFLNLGRR